jgi:choline dehydrogenase-like flavoprotein
MFHFRDPFERADENSNTYWDWIISHAYVIYGMQALVAQQIENFKKFPPRQKPASFNLDAVLRTLEDAGGGANHWLLISSMQAKVPRLACASGTAPVIWQTTCRIQRSAPRDPHHRRQQGQRAEARRLHPGQDGAVVHGGGHDRGRARAADNRETNVVDRFGFAHEVPNLGILGASVMGTSGAHNPTLTAQALAWRTAKHLSRNWGTIVKH